LIDPFGDSSEKLPARYRYFDVTSLFSWPYRQVVRILYPTPIRPEAVVLMSLLAGLVSAYFYSVGGYLYVLLGAFFIYVKNLLDTVDGHLARARMQVSRVGRFIDSLSDFVVFVFLMLGVATGLLRTGYSTSLIWLAIPATLSLFLQCSLFNYYLVTYVRRIDAQFPARTRETLGENESPLLGALKYFYAITYGWQDFLVEKIDAVSRNWANRSDEPGSFELSEVGWYNHRAFLTAESVLCFGTQIGFLVLCSIFNRLDLFVVLMVTVWNIYAIGLMMVRILFFRGLRRLRHDVSHPEV